jgi:hypothetical protein
MLTISEINEKLDINPQALIGKSYGGTINLQADDAGYFALMGDFVLIIDFDRTILEVILRD